MSARELLSYCNDIRRFMYRSAWKYPWAIFRPRIVWGYFDSGELSEHQARFFQMLLDDGFKRTVWQLILPGQTAGLIKNVESDGEGANQYHVRFYRNGKIDCEIEYGVFHPLHWRGDRGDSMEFLHRILEEWREEFREEEQKAIAALFGAKAPWHLE